ncbi:LuxR C-terminal-related transcriptional regulator [Aeromonas sp. QDB22]
MGVHDRPEYATVKVHVKNILKKLNLHSRIEVAVWVHNEKIIFD